MKQETGEQTSERRTLGTAMWYGLTRQNPRFKTEAAPDGCIVMRYPTRVYQNDHRRYCLPRFPVSFPMDRVKI